MIDIYCEIGDIIQITSRNAISVSTKISSMEDVDKPSYGVLSNSGNVSFNDYNDEVLNFIEQGKLTDGLPFAFYIKNTLVQDKSELVAKYISTDWEYDNDSKQVSCTITDGLEEMQRIEFSGLKYIWSSETFADVYKRLYAITPSKFSFIDFNNLDDSVKNKLNSSKTDYVYMKSGSLWNAWKKFANAMFCTIYNNGLKTVLNFMV